MISLIIVFFCTVHGAEIPKDYSQNINPPSKAVEVNNQPATSDTVLEDKLKCMSESLKENVYISAVDEISCILFYLSTHDVENNAYVLGNIDNRKAVNWFYGKLFSEFVNYISNSVNKSINDTNNIFTSKNSVIDCIKECLKIKNKELFIKESYNIVDRLRYSSRSKALTIWIEPWESGNAIFEFWFQKPKIYEKTTFVMVLLNIKQIKWNVDFRIKNILTCFQYYMFVLLVS